MRSKEELHQLQALPLEVKIEKTKQRIREWVDYYGENNVAVSFSGGKDSTVLMYIVRSMYPDMKAVFMDTGLEYPEIKDFIKCWDDVDIIKSNKNFNQVLCEYGYPFISKETSESIKTSKSFLNKCAEENGIDGENKYQKCIENLYKDVAEGKPSKYRLGMPLRMAQMLGQATVTGTLKMLDEDAPLSSYNKDKYQFFFEDGAPPVNNYCCHIMKKQPVYKYNKLTGRKTMTAQMATESRERAMSWLNNGCNAFNAQHPVSNPMAFWTEDDVFEYVLKYIMPKFTETWNKAANSHGSVRRKARKFLKHWNYSKTGIASVYGDIVIDEKLTYQTKYRYKREHPDATDDEMERIKRYTTTGTKRTGCMFCGYGLHLEKSPNRLELMSQTHPKQYDFLMRGGHFREEDGQWEPYKGLGYWYCIEWINIHGNLNIKYPNREYYIEKYSTSETDKYLKIEGINVTRKQNI